MNDARFPNTYRSVPYAAKPQARDGAHYIKATVGYVKYLIQDQRQSNFYRPSIHKY